MKPIIIIIFCFLNYISFSQENYFINTQLKTIGNFKKGNVNINLDYLVSNNILHSAFHYPTINLSYNITNKFTVHGGYKSIQSNGSDINIFGKNKLLKNNNSGLNFGLAYLGKTNFWFFTNYEVLIGFENTKIEIEKENSGYTWEVNTIIEEYNQNYIQLNLLKVKNKFKLSFSLNLSRVNYKEFINIENSAGYINYLEKENFNINNPILFTTSLTNLYALNNKNTLFIKSYFAFGASMEPLVIKFGNSISEDVLANFQIGVGLTYCFK